MESITDWAFSWPISGDVSEGEGLGWNGAFGRTLVVVYYVAEMVTT